MTVERADWRPSLTAAAVAVLLFATDALVLATNTGHSAREGATAKAIALACLLAAGRMAFVALWLQFIGLVGGVRIRLAWAAEAACIGILALTVQAIVQTVRVASDGPTALLHPPLSLLGLDWFSHVQGAASALLAQANVFELLWASLVIGVLIRLGISARQSLAVASCAWASMTIFEWLAAMGAPLLR